MDNTYKKLIFIIFLTFFSTNCFAMSATKTANTYKPFWESEGKELESPFFKKKLQQKKIQIFKKRPKIKYKEEKSEIEELKLPFEQWIQFIKKNWSDEKNFSEEHIKSVEKKCMNIEKIINKFIKTNLGLLKQNENWEGMETPETLKNLIEVSQSIKTDPTNPDEINIGAYLKKKSNKFVLPILPLAEKLIVPENSNVFVLGDFHGNFDAFVEIMQNFINDGIVDKKLKLQNNNYLIFLGDYTGRGQQALEILLSIFRLKIQNPSKVILIRGNHEKFQQNLFDRFLKDKKQNPGELEKKLFHLRLSPDEKVKKIYLNIINSIFYSYELMPITTFLGYESKQKPVEFIELSHGNIDHRYNPQDFLNYKLPKNKTFQFSEITLENFMDLESLLNKFWSINESKELAEDFGKAPNDTNDTIESFVWSDINKNINASPETTPFIMYNESRGYVGLIYTIPFIKQYFDKISTEKNVVSMLIRGHEHGFPYELRGRDGIGAVELGNTIITVLSGIYTTPNLGASFGHIQYFPTFLKLMPPSEDKNEWDIEIKYLKEKQEKAASKIQAMWHKYKEKRDKERVQIDEKFKYLKINENAEPEDLRMIIENIEYLDKNKESRKELSGLIKDNDIFAGNNQEFAKFILDLNYKSNYKSYLDEKIKSLISEELYQYESDDETESMTEIMSSSSSDYDYDDEDDENKSKNVYPKSESMPYEDMQKIREQRVNSWIWQNF